MKIYNSNYLIKVLYVQENISEAKELIEIARSKYQKKLHILKKKSSLLKDQSAIHTLIAQANNLFTNYSQFLKILEKYINQQYKLLNKNI